MDQWHMVVNVEEMDQLPWNHPMPFLCPSMLADAYWWRNWIRLINSGKERQPKYDL
jgi:hypothetical protein